jgi:DNA-binding MarR family transcriptional regulator
MPIPVETLQKEGTEVTKQAGKSAEVIAILKRRDAKGNRLAYSQSEIAELTDIRPQYARSILMSLVEKKKVERKQFNDGGRNKIYYAWVEDDTEEWQPTDAPKSGKHK